MQTACCRSATKAANSKNSWLVRCGRMHPLAARERAYRCQDLAKAHVLVWKLLRQHLLRKPCLEPRSDAKLAGLPLLCNDVDRTLCLVPVLICSQEAHSITLTSLCTDDKQPDLCLLYPDSFLHTSGKRAEARHPERVDVLSHAAVRTALRQRPHCTPHRSTCGRAAAAGPSASPRNTSGLAQWGVPQRWCGDGWHRTWVNSLWSALTVWSRLSEVITVPTVPLLHGRSRRCEEQGAARTSTTAMLRWQGQ